VTFPLNGIPYVQTINITNDVAPVIDAQADQVFMSSNVDCSSGDISFSRSGSDDCTATSDLVWTYEITSTNGFTQSGTGNTISGVFQTGIYSITWSLSDGCNNTTTDVQQMEIVNTKVPIPVCMNGISISLDGMSGTVELWASDIDGGTYHPCNNAFSISLFADGSSAPLTFGCGNLGVQLVNLYAIDTGTGLGDFCIATVTIQDPLEACNSMMLTVSGEVYTELYEEVEDVKVELAANMPHEMTDELGYYAFGQMPEGGSYDVLPSKNDNHLNGINTLDLIKMQRHILGLESLDRASI